MFNGLVAGAAGRGRLAALFKEGADFTIRKFQDLYLKKAVHVGLALHTPNGGGGPDDVAVFLRPSPLQGPALVLCDFQDTWFGTISDSYKAWMAESRRAPATVQPSAL